MSYHFLLILNPLIALGCNVISQLLFIRLNQRMGLLKSEYAGFLIAGIILVSLEWLRYLLVPQRCFIFLLTFVTNSIIYAALSYCYFNFVNLGETARRIRILRELNDAPKRPDMGRTAETLQHDRNNRPAYGPFNCQ